MGICPRKIKFRGSGAIGWNARLRDFILGRQFNLDRLRVLTSTGSVLSPDQFEWFYREAFPKSTHLASMSGGTDIAGCCTDDPLDDRHSPCAKKR